MTKVTGSDDLNLTVKGTTTLDGAAIIDETGEGSFTTDRLEVANISDSHQVDNYSASVSFGDKGVSNVGFSIEKRDRQGTTNATIAGVNTKITNTDQTNAEKQQVLASVNKDLDQV